MKSINIVAIICLVSLTACGDNSITYTTDNPQKYKGQILVPLPPFVITDEKKGN
jgi:uncharacterized lipoprotein YehR (DUF1307 family)